MRRRVAAAPHDHPFAELTGIAGNKVLYSGVLGNDALQHLRPGIDAVGCEEHPYQAETRLHVGRLNDQGLAKLLLAGEKSPFMA